MTETVIVEEAPDFQEPQALPDGKQDDMEEENA